VIDSTVVPLETATEIILTALAAAGERAVSLPDH
jgi:hypothetical protein